MKNFMDKRIELVVRAGANVGDCVREALAVAATEDCDVLFRHNGFVYTANINELALEVVRGKVAL